MPFHKISPFMVFGIQISKYLLSVVHKRLLQISAFWYFIFTFRIFSLYLIRSSLFGVEICFGPRHLQSHLGMLLSTPKHNEYCTQYVLISHVTDSLVKFGQIGTTYMWVSRANSSEHSIPQSSQPNRPNLFPSLLFCAFNCNDMYEECTEPAKLPYVSCWPCDPSCCQNQSIWPCTSHRINWVGQHSLEASPGTYVAFKLLCFWPS